MAPTQQFPLRDKRPERVEYEMPRPVISKIVHWFPDRFETDGYPAIVTMVGDRTLSLSIVLPNAYALECKTGVRHRSDPDRSESDNSGDGVWDFAAEADEELSGVLRNIRSLSDRIAAVNARIDAIEKKLSATPLTAASPPSPLA